MLSSSCFPEGNDTDANILNQHIQHRIVVASLDRLLVCCPALSRRAVLQTAEHIARHRALTTDATQGLGVDRHLFALLNLARADGGILSRADDMVCVRGVNVYPTAIEAVVRQFHDVLEFRSTVTSRNALLSLTIEIELRPGSEPDTAVAGVAQGLREATGLTVPVRVVSPGSLPRFELKARRFIVDPEARARHDSHDPEAGAPTDP